MLEQICPQCDAGNPMQNRYCSECGAPLQQPLVAGHKRELTAGRDRLLPAASWQQVGRAVAVSLAALAAEAGLAWLRRRVAQLDEPQAPAPAEETAAIVPGRSITTITGRRVVRVWQHGRLSGQVVEDAVWQIEE
jgi:hypothetical protein